MSMAEVLRAIVAVAIGVLLGSVLPADLLARRHGVDIRRSGDGNPGTTNAVRVLGWAPGLVTAAYDMSVGVISLQLAIFLGTPHAVAYLAGIASIVGHRYPVFTRFRGGGQGMAASAGLVLYGVAVALSEGWISVIDLGILAAALLGVLVWTRSDVVAAVVVLPLFVIRMLLTTADWWFLAFVTAVTAHIWIVQVFALRHPLARVASDTDSR